jgi:RHS repeat-associated protein
VFLGSISALGDLLQVIRRIPFLFFCLLFSSFSVLSQEIQYTQNNADRDRRSVLTVDPSSLALNLQIPIANYTGRAGMSLPIALQYSSKIWHMEYGGNAGLAQGVPWVYPAINSRNGWTSTLDAPNIALDALYFNSQGSPNGVQQGNLIYRINVSMPDGSTHELRKSDTPVFVNSFNPADWNGAYYAVDGSRLKLEYHDGANAAPNVLYLPNGSRYAWGTDANNHAAVYYYDRNGNTLTYSQNANGQYQWTDTIGRVIGLVPAGTGVGYQTYSIPGVGSSSISYTLRWQNLEDVRTDASQALRSVARYSDCDNDMASTHSSSLFANGNSCEGDYKNTLFNPVVLSEIALPNGTSYKFTYNVFGEIDKIVYPSGGYERFQYDTLPTMSYVRGDYSQSNRGVVDRWVSVDGTGNDEAANHWHYQVSYPSNQPYKVTITAPDGSYVERYLYSGATWPENKLEDIRIGRAYDERSYSATGQMLRRTLSDWTGDTTTDRPLRNPRVTRQTNIILDTGGAALASTKTFQYDATYAYSTGVNLTSESEYAFTTVDQSTAQTGTIAMISQGTLVRSTETTFLDSDANYRNRNIVGLPTSTRVKDAGGTIVAQSAISYDESSYPLLTCGASIGWSDPQSTYRGNATTVSRWLDSNNSWPSTHVQYDQCGNVRVAWDAIGNQSQISYSSTYGYAYPTQTTSAVPDPTGAHGSTTALVQSTVYDFNTGLVTSATDANNKTTTFEYDDALNRLTKVNLPDGGWSSTSYGDTPGNLYVRSQTLQATTPSQKVIDAYQYFDGLGRAKRSYLNDGTVNTPWLMTVTDYDPLGRVSRVSNPYRVNTQGATVTEETLYWTTTAYDDLGRVKMVTTPDNAHVDTAYSASTSGTLGTIVTVTDQALRKRRSLTDALGRLVRVDEPDKDSGVLDDANGPVQSTSYMYDVLGNLRKVDQGGQQRFFMYDSLSRLLRARNPEQNANGQFATSADPVSGNTSWSMFYAYDLNGNLTTRMDARDLRADYAYDALNRNYSIAYSGPNISTPNVTRVYDSATNGKGRLASVSSSVSTLTHGAYDSMGRVTSASQTIGGRTFSMAYAYDYAGQVKSMTYPSGHVVNYAFDVAGRINNFTGNLGDGVTRTYSTAVSYSEFGGIKEEQFGTATPLYHKQRYNLRGQLWDMRLSTVSAATDAANGDRGAIVNYYTSDYVQDSGTKNNGSLWRQEAYIPGSSYFQDTFDYDYLNRLKFISEKLNGTGSDSFKQAHTYDRWGNRTIDQANTTSNIPHPNFTVDTGTNRLNAPSGYTFGYDTSGNQYADNYGDGSGGVSYARTYDHENRMVSSTATYANPPQVLTSTYTYDADGRRIKRNVNGTETWQVYGVGGELLAEYVPGAATFLPTKEYGYRGGQLLVTMSSGDDLRLLKFLHKMYDGALGRSPNSTEQQQGMDSLSAAGAQGQAQLLSAAQTIAQTLFNSDEYDSRHRSDADFVNDLYWTYPQRAADAGGYQAWLNAIPTSGRSGVRDGFAGSSEFSGLVSRIYGVTSSDDLRTILFIYKLYSALNRDPSSSELQAGIDRLNAKAIIGQSEVIDEARSFAGEIFSSDEYTNRHRTDREFVQDLYLATIQRAPDTAGWDSWTNAASSDRTVVRDGFLNSGEFQYLAGTLYREEFWLVSDHLGTPRMVVDKSGSLAGIKRHDYLPFGEELFAGTGGRATAQGYVVDSTRQKFTQKERDIETGLDYFGARYLSSTQGRFVSVDPALTSASVGTPQSWNRYAYSFNNPLKYIDPTGAWNWSATLGGSDSDADLLSNAGTDKKKIKAANKIIEQRNLFRNALADAAAAGPSSDEPDSVARAVNAYGSEGDSNGVTVTFGKTANGIAAEAGASPNGALSFNANGSVTAQVLVTISSSVTNANELAQAVGHEGWHTADRQSFAAYLTRQFQAVGGAQNFGTADETRAYNSPYNRTVQTTELGAYIVSGLIAQGRDALGKNFPNSNFNGHEVWNNSWSAAERPGLRAVGAFEHVTTSPTYANKLTDRQFPH